MRRRRIAPEDETDSHGLRNRQVKSTLLISDAGVRQGMRAQATGDILHINRVHLWRPLNQLGDEHKVPASRTVWDRAGPFVIRKLTWICFHALTSSHP